jgi:hypothetical protein
VGGIGHHGAAQDLTDRAYWASKSGNDGGSLNSAAGVYRATRRETRPWEAFAEATSPWVRSSATTAVMTSRAFGIRRRCRPGHSYVVLKHAIRMS